MSVKALPVLILKVAGKTLGHVDGAKACAGCRHSKFGKVRPARMGDLKRFDIW